MTVSDLPLDYKEQIREFHPKRDQMNKIHHWRWTTLEDNLIAKVVLIDGLKKDEPLEDDISQQIIAHVDQDWTQISVTAMYSMKKHRRWELPNLLENYLPRFEDGYRIPLPVTGTSLARFSCYRTHGYSPRCWYSRDMRYYGKHVKKLTVLDRKSERKDYPGGMNKGNIGDIIRSLEKDDETKGPTIHVQFQTLEFRMVPRKHNSRKYDYRSGRCRYDKDPIFNHLILREECEPLISEDPSSYCSECGADKDYGTYYYAYACDCLERYQLRYFAILYDMECIECEPSPPLTRLFGDFFDVHNIPRENRCKKRDLKDWVLV